MSETTKLNGKVKFFNSQKAFGFIADNESKNEYFVHITGCLDTITENDNVEFKNDDIIIDGRSMKDAARTKVVMETRIVQYMKLLITEDGQSLDDLEYSDVELEFPFSVQIKFIEKITEAISPNYKEIRGK